MRSCHQHLRVNIAHFVINLSIADSASSALYVRESSPQPCPPQPPTPPHYPESNPVNIRCQFCSLIKNALCVCGRKRAFVRATLDQTAVVLTWNLSWICAMTHPPGSRRVPPRTPLTRCSAFQSRRRYHLFRRSILLPSALTSLGASRRSVHIDHIGSAPSFRWYLLNSGIISQIMAKSES